MDELKELQEERRELERRLDRLSGVAEARARGYLEVREALSGVEDFLALSPGAAARLEVLTSELFGQVMDEIEVNLTHAVREILAQDREVKARREVKGNRLFIHFEMVSQGGAEDIMTGQGGSVCNIMSVGLRLLALSQLDSRRHRPFLVLDEQDCWLRPDLVPRFAKLIRKIGHRLGFQVLYISHHPVDHFMGEAAKVFLLRQNRENGVAVEVLLDKTAVSAGNDA
jgi:chromosome segregation ATPase